MEEGSLERSFYNGVKKAGCNAVKITGFTHYPDRLVLIPGTPAHVIWVELKAPGKKPRKGQRERIRRLKAMGFQVDVIATRLELKEWLEKLRS